MPLVTCPGCARQISGAAPACPHCGRPNPAAPPAPYRPAPGAPAAAAAKAGMPVWLIVLLVAGGGFALVIVLGILAAIAIPKFASVSEEAKYAEATPFLKHLVNLQEFHRTQYGAYADELTELTGFMPPPAQYFEFGVSAVTGSTFCIEATPSAGGREAGLEPRSMDQAGTLYRGAGCQVPLEEGA